MNGRVVGLQRSGGGVPKLPVQEAEVRITGLEGDWQRNRKYHGGPDRALCLYSMELIDALKAEGHPICAGSTGENVTLAGIDWREMLPGVRLRVGAAEIELTDFAVPCKTIAGSFAGGRSVRIGERLYPGWSRIYARVTVAGRVAVDDSVELVMMPKCSDPT